MSKLVMAIKIARLIVVVPIAIVWILTLPFWEFWTWLFDDRTDDNGYRKYGWYVNANWFIAKIAKFVWP